jgi:TonB family protein
MRSFLVVLTLVACAATAQAASPFGSDCKYPLAARAAGPANTDLNFTVAADGSLQDVKVRRSSQNPALDAAAVKCVSNWRASGDPKWQTAVINQYISIFWDSDVSPRTGRASLGRPHVCKQDYPADSVQLGEQGTTTVGYRITVQGTVKDPRVVVSSGSERLDGAALACVANWRYLPARDAKGEPVEVEWTAKVLWSLR